MTEGSGRNRPHRRGPTRAAAVRPEAARHATGRGRTLAEEAEGQSESRPWGELPLLAAIAAFGLITVAVADDAGRFGQGGLADILFWVGVVAIFAPAAARCALPTTPRMERVGSVVMVALAIYGVKVLGSPFSFTFGDELSHWRTASDILATGHLFSLNPLSLTSPVFPGLQIATTALVNLTGLSIYTAGLLVVGVGRFIVVLAVYLLVERFTGSSRVAALASFIYMGNPNFMFFTAQYSYESLALPLAVLALYLAAIRTRSGVSARAIDGAMLVIILAVVITHHLTAYLLVALLGAWTGLTVLLRRRGKVTFPAPYLMTGVTAVAAVGWLFTGAPITLTYLLPVIQGAIQQVLDIATRKAAVKPLFAGNASLVAPTWERVVAFSDVAIVSALLVVGLVWFTRRHGRWRRYRDNALALAVALTAILEFPALALRLVPRSSEISNRSSEFLFLPIGFVVTLVLVHLLLARASRRLRPIAWAMVATMIFMGGVVIGQSPWARIPGPYLVTGDTRAIRAEGLIATAWLRSELGTGRRLIADQTNEKLMGSYGGEDPVHDLSWIYFASGLDGQPMDALANAGVEFIVVDYRMTTMLPVVGYYYENREPGGGRHTEPMQPSELDKFDGRPDMTRIYDSGNIVIYAVAPQGA